MWHYQLISRKEGRQTRECIEWPIPIRVWNQTWCHNYCALLLQLKGRRMSQEDIGLPGMVALDRMNSRHIPQSGAQMTWLIIVRLKETYLKAHSLFSFHLLLIVMIRCLLQSSRSETVRTWSDSRIQTQGNQVCVSILCQPCMSEAVRVKESPKSHLDCWIFAKSFWEESLEPSRIWVGCVDIFSLLSPSKSKQE